MKRLSIVALLSLLLMIAYSTSCTAGWLIYHKPEYAGKVIDAETKEPIEGAVVVVVYYKQTIIGIPQGTTSIMDAKETLTNEKGEFRIPSYITIMGPNTAESMVNFVIYKPGYGNFPKQRISPPIAMGAIEIEIFFRKENFGKQGELRLTRYPPREPWKGTYGLVELPKAKTRKERLKALRLPSIGKPLPIVSKMLREESERLFGPRRRGPK